MKKNILPVLLFLVFQMACFGSPARASSSVLMHEALDIDGNSVQISDYQGRVLLVVNTASKCGYTKQYASLQKLYEIYRDQGFEVLAFPANNFGEQEPGTNEEIKKFCDLRFKTTFPLFSKIDVKGEGMHPFYKELTESPDHRGAITWNFTKFLIDREGRVIGRYEPSTDPLDAVVTEDIEAAL